MRDPGRMLCQGCYQDLVAAGYDEGAGVWQYECAECPGVDGPLTVDVRDADHAAAAPHAEVGVMAELGVCEVVQQALGRRPGRWLEFAVVEQLYAQLAPDAYRSLVDHFGHRAISPDLERTASWSLGRALWALKRENQVLVKTMPHGTGRWSYLAPCHAWALPGISGNSTVVTWEAFAEEHGFDPHSHPAIDWRDTPNAAPVVAEVELAE